MSYGIATDYEYSSTHKRERLVIWSGPFFSVYEGEAFSLPGKNGYMVTTYNDVKLRVPAPCPRTDDNYLAVDSALSDALSAFYDLPATA